MLRFIDVSLSTHRPHRAAPHWCCWVETQEKNSNNWRAIGWLLARYEMVQKRKVSIPRWETSQSPTWEWLQCYLLSVLPETLCSQQSARPVVQEPNLAEFLRDGWSFPDGFIREKTFKHWTTVAILLIWDTLNLMLDSDLQSEWDRWGDAFQALHKGACQKWSVFQFKRLFLTWFFFISAIVPTALSHVWQKDRHLGLQTVQISAARLETSVSRFDLIRPPLQRLPVHFGNVF